MARKGLSVCAEKFWHVEAVTLKLRSRSFSHKSDISAIWWDIMTRFDDLESLMKDTHFISLDDLTLTSGSMSTFHRKMLHFGFSHFICDLSHIFYWALFPLVSNVDLMWVSHIKVIAWPLNLGKFNPRFSQIRVSYRCRNWFSIRQVAPVYQTL